MRRSLLLAVAVPVVAFAVYILTLRPSVGWIDCGELVAGCYLLNVLHPTGYPLYTLVGYLFSHIPLGTVAARVNAMSALFSSLAALFCFLSVVRITKSQVAGVAAAALFAFSSTVWSSSVEAEVFGLTAFFVALTVYLLATLPESTAFLGVAYLLGMALTNHMSYLGTCAGAAVYLVLLYRREVLRPAALFPFIGLFLLGLTPYAYLLIRSHAQPVMNWGSPDNLQRLLRHVTGGEFRGLMFSTPFASVLKNLATALSVLAQELYYVLVPVFLWGAWLLFRRFRDLFWLLAAVFGLSLFLAASYSIPEIRPYYIPSFAVAFIATGVGLADVVGRARRVPEYVLLLLVVLPLAVNLDRSGARGDRVAEDLAAGCLKTVPADAILMTTNWDIYSPILYLRHVERQRPDLCVIDKEMLRQRWYVRDLGREYPWLVERSRPEIDRYLHYLDRFEHGELRDDRPLQDAFVALVASFTTRNPERRTFATFDSLNDDDAAYILPELHRVPYGLCFELRAAPGVDSFDYNQLALRLRGGVMDDRTRLNLSAYCERFACEHAYQLAQASRRAEAIADLKWVLAHFPKSVPAAGLLARLEARP